MWGRETGGSAHECAELAEDAGGRAPDAVAADGVGAVAEGEVADRRLDELDLGGWQGPDD